jgi:predicted lactoylglutathione lyase
MLSINLKDFLKERIEETGEARAVVYNFPKNERPSHWNSQGQMDKYKGEVIKIRVPKSEFYEFSSKHVDGHCWAWNASDFDVEKTLDLYSIFSSDLFKLE